MPPSLDTWTPPSCFVAQDELLQTLAAVLVSTSLANMPPLISARAPPCAIARSVIPLTFTFGSENLIFPSKTAATPNLVPIFFMASASSWRAPPAARTDSADPSPTRRGTRRDRVDDGRDHPRAARPSPPPALGPASRI